MYLNFKSTFDGFFVWLSSVSSLIVGSILTLFNPKFFFFHFHNNYIRQFQTFSRWTILFAEIQMHWKSRIKKEYLHQIQSISNNFFWRNLIFSSENSENVVEKERERERELAENQEDVYQVSKIYCHKSFTFWLDSRREKTFNKLMFEKETK